MICELRQKYPLEILLDISKIARSSYYYHVKTSSVLNKHEDAKKEINKIYNDHKGRYGYRRITLEMKNRGTVINHKTVSKLMSGLGLKSLIRRKNTSPIKEIRMKQRPTFSNRTSLRINRV